MLSLREELNGLVLSHTEHGLRAEDLSREGALSPAAAVPETEHLFGFDRDGDAYNIP